MKFTSTDSAFVNSSPNPNFDQTVFAFAFDFVESLGLSGLKKVESQANFNESQIILHQNLENFDN